MNDSRLHRNRARTRSRVAFSSLLLLGGSAACNLVLGIDELPGVSVEAGAEGGPAIGADGAPSSDAMVADGLSPAPSDGGRAGPDAVATLPADAGGTTYLDPGDGGWVGFGNALAFSGDGTLLAVGAPGAEGQFSGVLVPGVVEIFARQLDGTWAPGPVISVDADAFSFGTSVAFGPAAAQGMTVPLAVGAPFIAAEPPMTARGVAYIFQVDATGGEILTTVPPPAEGGGFGTAVAIVGSAGSALVFIGAPGKMGAASITSATLSGVNMQSTEGPPDGGGRFGAALASAAGSPAAIVGAPGANAAYLSTSGVFTPAPEGDASALGLGTSVAMAPGGKMVIVGAPQENGAAGAAYLYGVSDSGKLVPVVRVPGAVAGDLFGSSVAIGTSTFAVGAPGAAEGGTVTVYSYAASTAKPKVTYSAAVASEGTMATIGGSLAIDPQTDLLAIGVSSSAAPGRVVLIR